MPIAREMLCVTLLGMAIAPRTLFAAAGDLDLGFGTSGSVITSIGPGNDVAGDVAIQPDGKIVAVGGSSNDASSDFVVARYDPDGSLDASFGTGGIVTTAISSDYDAAGAVALEPDGRIVAMGTSRG